MLKKDIPAGLVTLRVRENRSGLSQTSNALTFKVVSGPVPLDLWADELESVSPGQSLDLVYTSDNVLKKATRLEVTLKQANQLHTEFITDFKAVKVRIPKTFAPGKAEIQTRIWIGDEASEWSAAISYNISENSKAAIIYSVRVIPARAEAMFKQEGKVIATTPVIFGSPPKAAIPEKLTAGNVEVSTRYWQNGKFTDWKLHSSPDFPSKELEGNLLELV